jgi:hypothetical protein
VPSVCTAWTKIVSGFFIEYAQDDFPLLFFGKLMGVDDIPGRTYGQIRIHTRLFISVKKHLTIHNINVDYDALLSQNNANNVKPPVFLSTDTPDDCAIDVSLFNAAILSRFVFTFAYFMANKQRLS